MSTPGRGYTPEPPSRRGMGCAIFLLLLANLQLLLFTAPVVGVLVGWKQVEPRLQEAVNQEKARLEGEFKELMQKERAKTEEDLKEIVRQERLKIEQTIQRELNRAPRERGANPLPSPRPR